MPRYNVTVTFDGYHEVKIKAATAEQAKEKVQDLLDSGDLEPDHTEYFRQDIFDVELLAEVTCLD
jgi:hypothetical protein